METYLENFLLTFFCFGSFNSKTIQETANQNNAYKICVTQIQKKKKKRIFITVELKDNRL